MAGDDLSFACTCGTVKGRLVGVGPGNGNRTDCYCGDCRAAQAYAGGTTEASEEPVRLFQTTPNRIRFDTGLDQLAVFSLSGKGVLRWYARCCGAMLFNTPRTPKLAFAAFFTDRALNGHALGPVKTRVHLQKPDGKTRHEGLFGAVISLARNAIPARLAGTWRETPFFDTETCETVRDIYVLSKTERAALYGAPL